MRIQLSDHFNYNRLIRFVLPSILMMIFTSLYTIVDGFFVSNFVGKTPFAALNFIWPVIQAVSGIGFMIATGGSAYVAKLLGQNKNEEANHAFSLLIYATIVLGIIISIIFIALTPQIAYLLGARGVFLENCIIYGRINFFGLTFYILQCIFQSFFIVAEKPSLSLHISIISGICNAILDLVFMGILGYGLASAAWATVIGQMVGAIIPLIYFFSKNNSLLRLTKTEFKLHTLTQSFSNGASEMVTNISASVVGMLFNFQLMSEAGENGVAAYGAIMYVVFVFTAINIGYSMGSAPIVSYNYGSANKLELQNIFKKSIILLTIVGVVMMTLSEVLAIPLVKIFASYDQELFNVTLHGFRVYVISFLLNGFNMWGSAFFTALNNGRISAILSFFRTFVFQVSCVLILPMLFGIDGIWSSIVLAEILSSSLLIYCIVNNRDHYRYY